MLRQLREAGTDAAEPVDKTTQCYRQAPERSADPLHVRWTIHYKCQSSYISSFYDSDGDLDLASFIERYCLVSSSRRVALCVCIACVFPPGWWFYPLVGQRLTAESFYIKNTSKCQPCRDKGTPAKPQARRCSFYR